MKKLAALGAALLVSLLCLGFFPLCGERMVREARLVLCTNNLKRIGELADIYRKSGFGGDGYCWPGEIPEELGAGWHRIIRDRLARGGDEETIFRCPLDNRVPRNEIDYRGPSRSPNVSTNYGTDDAIAGDRLGNHGDTAVEPLNVLTKRYRVITIRPSDTLRWEQYLAGTQD